PPQYKKWVEQKHAVVIEEKVETVSSERIGITIRQAPKFVNQVPNLTLKPGVEAVIDVEVEASPPAKHNSLDRTLMFTYAQLPNNAEIFVLSIHITEEMDVFVDSAKYPSSYRRDRFTWFVNGFELRDSSGRLEVYYPKENRCVARCITCNNFGEKRVITLKVLQGGALYDRTGDFFERMNKGRASSVTKNYEVYEESSYYQRSTSLPRPMRGIEKHIEVSSNADLLRRRQEETDATAQYSSTREIATQREDDHTETLYRTTSESFHFLPQAPLFVSALPKDVHLSSNEKLVLSVDVKASPPAKIAWKLDGTEVVQSE
uniref:Ig-like domain-containing protein n=1 Tax=Parascaris equorum TaxID=6256 RepID=A0A914S160_PAREQ